MNPVRSLHIDIEGGWGGSSRSLFELLSRLDRRRVLPVVAHRVDGPITQRYAEIGIPTVHVPEIFSYAPRKHKSFKNLVFKLPELILLPKAARKIGDIAHMHKTEVIHLNYEGLFLLARLLSKQLNLPIVGHSRTQIPNNFWGRWEVFSLAKTVSHMFFISPVEQQAFIRHAATPSEIMWNIAKIPTAPPDYPEYPVVVYLGNIDYEKGTDRLIDIAISLEKISAPPLKINVYGVSRNKSKYFADLERRVKDNHLEHRITFEGHTSNPESVLSSALALIRTSRWNDPWGRDVIEATSLGVPVLATGSFEGVVENRKTGFLYDKFEADDFARTLVHLIEDRSLWEQLSTAALEKGQSQFLGETQSLLMEKRLESLARR